MKQESGRLGVYLGPYSPCGLGPVTVPTWASNEGGELINVYGSFHSTESLCKASSVDASDLRYHW